MKRFILTSSLLASCLTVYVEAQTMGASQSWVVGDTRAEWGQGNNYTGTKAYTINKRGNGLNGGMAWSDEGPIDGQAGL